MIKMEWQKEKTNKAPSLTNFFFFFSSVLPAREPNWHLGDTMAYQTNVAVSL